MPFHIISIGHGVFHTVFMAPAVEASSLSKVLDLADSPPLHLRDDVALEVQQPLVLYIARVPGSKGRSPLDLHSMIRTRRLHRVRYFPHNHEATAKSCDSSRY